MRIRALWPCLMAALVAGIGSAVVLGQSGGAAPTAGVTSEPPRALSGTLPDGSPYRVVRPAAWNGTLVLDLDFITNAAAPPGAIERWMLEQGYAIGGIAREPVAYQFPRAVDDLLAVRQLFIAAGNATPTRTLSLGNSRGAFVSRIALEHHADVFVGALLSAGGGAGEVALHNAKLDALWALKQFSGAPLTVAGFPTQADAAAEGRRIQEAVATLQASPLGRARLTLAAAFEQLPAWADGDAPPDETDIDGLAAQFGIGFTAGHPAVVRYNIEQTVGGIFSWNDGVDYRELLSRSRWSAAVRAAYRAAGGDLEADLDTLVGAQRISASPAAVRRTEELASYSGRLSSPVLVVDNIGDPFDVDAFDSAYEQNVANAGAGALLRTTWVRSARHSTLSPLERVTGFVTLIERLDSGRWPDTSPAAMNARAEQVRVATAIDLGPPRFIPWQPAVILRPWDARHWGSYQRP